MDIQSLLARRTQWQPFTASATGATQATKNSEDVASSDAAGSSAAGESSSSQGGITGTTGTQIEGLSKLELPSADSVKRDKAALGNELQMALGIAGIRSSPPITFIRNDEGEVDVAADDPRRAEIMAALDNQPDLKQRLGKLVGDAQLMEHAAAQTGWYRQINAGTGEADANRNLISAAKQIDAASDFTLEGNELTLEVTGMGEKLMQAGVAPPTDDEKMWRETLRLTERSRLSDPAARPGSPEARKREEEEEDRRGGHIISQSQSIGQNNGNAQAA